MEEINNFHMKPDDNLYQAWERFKELLMKCPQHYLTEMQEVILFYNGLGIPTRQILDSRGAIPFKTVADAKEKDLGSFTLPCFINNVCFDNALVDLGASVSVMPLSAYLNLGLGELVHTKLTVELADRTVKISRNEKLITSIRLMMAKEIQDERQELCETHELPVCNIRRFKMIKYSFGQDEEYVAVKEDEYDDLVKTSDDACRAYQEIFRIIDEGWMVTRAE
ncbi:homeodomain-like protein [Tanacetum coccineum]